MGAESSPDTMDDGRGEGGREETWIYTRNISSRENLMSKIGFKQLKAVSTRTGTRDPGLVGCASCQEMCWMLLESSRGLKIFRQKATAFYSRALGSQCGSLSEWLSAPVILFSPNDLH